MQGIVQASVPVMREAHGSRSILSVAVMLWIVGAAICLFVCLLLFLYHIFHLADAIPIQENPFLNEWIVKQHLHRKIRIYHSDRIQDPITYGILKPRILLPSKMDFSDSETLMFVLQHELVHIKRMDTVWKIILCCTVSVYWFNPAVWVFIFCVNRDLEISCDEHVLKKAGFSARQRYARALVRMAETGSNLNPGASGFSHNALEERVVAVMYSKRTSAWAVALGFVLTVASISVFAAAPKALDFPVSFIPLFYNPGSILSAGRDGNLYVENPGLAPSGNTISSFPEDSSSNMAISEDSAAISAVQPSGKPDAGTHMPNREPGMRFVYDGGRNLIKITNADSSLYYFPGDSDTPTAYQGSTWFVIDPAVNPSQKGVAFNIDTIDGMQNAQSWIKKHINTEKQHKIANSLQAQRGTKCTIYYEWLIS